MRRFDGITTWRWANQHIVLLLIMACGSASSEVRNAVPAFFFGNTTQFNSGSRFILNAPELNAAFTRDAVQFEKKNQRINLHFDGANPDVSLEGGDRISATVNVLVGRDSRKWIQGAPAYKSIVYRRLYSGIDLTYSLAGSQVKSEFVVEPHADPGQIQLEYPAAARVFLDANGNLVVATGAGELRERAPTIYQESPHGRIQVGGKYRLLDAHVVGFEIGEYDHNQALTIDPVVTYATYLGGSGLTSVNGIAADSMGNIYVAGSTEALNFPIVGALQPSNNGGVDIFVAKFAPNGSSLLYATYVGGSGEDSAASIAVDSQGQAYVTGFTTSTNFPILHPLQSGPPSGHSAVIFKLNTTGNQFIYSTYFGGRTWDSGTAITADTFGNAYIAGDTQSSNLPVLDAVQPAFGGQTDAFVAKLTTAGSLSYCTYLGGSAADHAGAIAVDSSGDIYIAGGTFSTNFPTWNAVQRANAGRQDAFLTKINAGGNLFVYSTYFGGNGGSTFLEEINGVALDSAGDAYVAGVTNSADFPVSSRALRASYNGSQDAFVAEFASNGALLYATYLGGSESNWASGLAVDSSGNAYVVGVTSSGDFPLMNPIQSSFGGLYDAFVSQIAPGGTTLLFSTYYGGSGSDGANAVALDATGNIYLAGQTASSDFPLVSALEQNYGGFSTGFVIGLAAALRAAVDPWPASGATGVAVSPVLSWSEAGATSFDVYLGTSPSPSYVATVYSTAYSAGTLLAGQTYYWRVVSKSGSTAMSSSTWSFTAIGNGCSYTLNPASATAPAAAGSASVLISSGAGCLWSANSNAAWLTITSGTSGSGSGLVSYSISANTGMGVRNGTLTIAGLSFPVSQAGFGGPLLTAGLTHAGSLAEGQMNAQYVATVSNSIGYGSTSGTVTVTELPPSGLSVVSITGAGWSCAGAVCSRSDPLSGGASYPPLTLAVDIASTAGPSITNALAISGGGSPAASASDNSILTTGLQFYPLSPCRVVDTRATQNKTGAFGPPSLAAYSERTIPMMASACGIPVNARAYSLNVTVVPFGPLSFLSMWPSNASYPGVSTQNSPNGSVLANAVLIPAGTDQQGSVTVVAGNPTDLIIDIDGYFAPSGSGATYYPVPQCRVVDTQSGSGFPAGFGPPSMAGYARRNFSVTGSCGVPSSADAFALNFSTIPPGNPDFLSTWAGGQSYPGVSTLNSNNGVQVSNLAVVPAGTGGSITVVTGNPTDLWIDVEGYFSAGGGGLRFYPMMPCRVVDTRSSQPKTGAFGPPSLAAYSTRSFPLLSGGCNIPATAQVYSLNVTVAPLGPLSSLVLAPAGAGNSGISTISSSNGNVIAVAALVPAGNGGAIAATAGNAVDLILDINGYFAP